MTILSKSSVCYTISVETAQRLSGNCAADQRVSENIAADQQVSGNSAAGQWKLCSGSVSQWKQCSGSAIQWKQCIKTARQWKQCWWSVETTPEYFLISINITLIMTCTLSLRYHEHSIKFQLWSNVVSSLRCWKEAIKCLQIKFIAEKTWGEVKNHWQQNRARQRKRGTKQLHIEY